MLPPKAVANTSVVTSRPLSHGANQVPWAGPLMQCPLTDNPVSPSCGRTGTRASSTGSIRSDRIMYPAPLWRIEGSLSLESHGAPEAPWHRHFRITGRMRHTGWVAKPWWLDVRGSPPSYQRRANTPLSQWRVLFLRILFPAFIVGVIGFTIAQYVLFRDWWTVGWIIYPLFQWVGLPPLHRSQILGRAPTSLPPEDESRELQRAW